ncbi:MAG: cysteine desulfurase [Clostridiales bacterium]|nr:cysteine desulfurase [Clostridiales bacterium]
MECKKRVYLDHAATTPMRPEVIDAMSAVMSDTFGNPSSLHREGQRAKKLMEEARESIATSLRCDPQEILFTSGGTESDNWAIKCASWRAAEDDGISPRNGIITSSVEHPAVLHSCESLEKHGLKVTYLPVDEFGLVSNDSLVEALSPETSLVSIMFANNEIGTIEPIVDLCRVSHEKGALFHTDAVQAVGAVPVEISDLGVDLLSFSAHKFGGPKGVGGLYVRKELKLPPFLNGGAQESHHRAGTENLPGIVGMARALELAIAEREETGRRVQVLSEKLMALLKEKIPNVRFNGHSTLRLPGIVNFTVPGADGEKLLLLLDIHGFACSAGAACSSKDAKTSHVLTAIGLSQEDAASALRISIGRENTEDDIIRFADALSEIVGK